MDPARIFTESLTPRPELENSQGHERPKGDVRVESARLPTADIGRRGPQVAFVPTPVIQFPAARTSRSQKSQRSTPG
jgi:hypothetical protein